MRWKRLVCGAALLLAALVAPASATSAVTVVPGPSPWPVGMVDWLEPFWSRLVGLAASEAPLDAATVDEDGPERAPIAPTASEPDREAGPSAEGGPEWDPDGNS